MQHKKGVWVTDRMEVFQLEEDAEENSYVDMDCELWKPKEEEWCWDTKHRQLVQVTFKKIGIYDLHGYTINGYPHELKFNDIEPFVGKLPTFLKNKTEREEDNVTS